LIPLSATGFTKRDPLSTSLVDPSIYITLKKKKRPPSNINPPNLARDPSQPRHIEQQHHNTTIKLNTMSLTLAPVAVSAVTVPRGDLIQLPAPTFTFASITIASGTPIATEVLNNLHHDLRRDDGIAVSTIQYAGMPDGEPGYHPLVVVEEPTAMTTTTVPPATPVVTMTTTTWIGPIMCGGDVFHGPTPCSDSSDAVKISGYKLLVVVATITVVALLVMTD
jgi:hypothetical protein